jgi:hypothetical protein
MNEDNHFKPFKEKFNDNDSFNLSLDIGAKGSIEERRKDIRDYYNAFKIEINKEYFLDKASKNIKIRRNSAKFISINQKNAFNFDIGANNPSQKNKRTSIMNTSIDRMKSGRNHLGELMDTFSNNSEKDKTKLSGFFSGNKPLANETNIKANNKSHFENSIFSNEIKNYKRFPETKFKPKFSLDVHEYHAPKKNPDQAKKSSPHIKMPSNMMKTHIALYNNKILEESYSKGGSPKLMIGEKTISSKVHPSPNLRSNSVNKEVKQKESYIPSIGHANSNMALSNHSNENNISNTFQPVAPEQLNKLLQKQSEAPMQNKSMFPHRQFSRLHQSNNILPNSEDIRNSKLKNKASLQSNVQQIRFQNYQTIVSLKSEMNLQSKKNKYKKMQRQVLKNFRHPQSPFAEGRQIFKSSSSIESGDSDQEMNLEKAYCIICGLDFRYFFLI